MIEILFELELWAHILSGLCNIEFRLLQIIFDGKTVEAIKFVQLPRQILSQLSRLDFKLKYRLLLLILHKNSYFVQILGKIQLVDVAHLLHLLGF